MFQWTLVIEGGPYIMYPRQRLRWKLGLQILCGIVKKFHLNLQNEYLCDVSNYHVERDASCIWIIFNTYIQQYMNIISDCSLSLGNVDFELFMHENVNDVVQRWWKYIQTIDVIYETELPTSPK